MLGQPLRAASPARQLQLQQLGVRLSALGAAGPRLGLPGAQQAQLQASHRRQGQRHQQGVGQRAVAGSGSPTAAPRRLGLVSPGDGAVDGRAYHGASRVTTSPQRRRASPAPCSIDRQSRIGNKAHHHFNVAGAVASQVAHTGTSCGVVDLDLVVNGLFRCGGGAPPWHSYANRSAVQPARRSGEPSPAAAAAAVRG